MMTSSRVLRESFILGVDSGCAQQKAVKCDHFTKTWYPHGFKLSCAPAPSETNRATQPFDLESPGANERAPSLQHEQSWTDSGRPGCCHR